MRLLGGEISVAEQIEVHSLDSLGARLYKAQVGNADLANRQQVGGIVHDASTKIGNHKFSPNFLSDRDTESRFSKTHQKVVTP